MGSGEISTTKETLDKDDKKMVVEFKYLFLLTVSWGDQSSGRLTWD